MVRRRLVLFVTLAALLAPWVAPCFAAAPAGHARMACCRPGERGIPIVRPCCAPAERQPAGPVSPEGRVAPLDLPAVRVAAVAPVSVFRLQRERDLPVPPLTPRALSSVLLI